MRCLSATFLSCTDGEDTGLQAGAVKQRHLLYAWAATGCYAGSVRGQRSWPSFVCRAQ